MQRHARDNEGKCGVLTLQLESPPLMLGAGPGGANIAAQSSYLLGQIADRVCDFPTGQKHGGNGAERGD